MLGSATSFFRTLRRERIDHGWKRLVETRGWKLVVLFVLAYLVRDTVLYILIPLAVIAGFKG
ncbi:MAG: hypothetical protein BMS9Abin29_1256 [Gemmatimonadota bacterium]|nr:MAG: hypothetical protein BMS9Abin29_1256 [Gemmatimonadota bacterium]